MQNKSIRRNKLQICQQSAKYYLHLLRVQKNVVDGGHALISAKGKMKLHIQQKQKPVERIKLQPNIIDRKSYPAVGVGKEGKGVGGKGKVGTQRTAMKRYAKASVEGITKGDIRRLARKGGYHALFMMMPELHQNIFCNLYSNDYLQRMCKKKDSYCIGRSLCAQNTQQANLSGIINIQKFKKYLIESNNEYKQTKRIRKARKLTKKEKLRAQMNQRQNFAQKVIQYQNALGFWSDQSLVSQILNESDRNKVDWMAQSHLLMTILLTEWLEKNFPQCEYSLIINKANNWMKKQPNHPQIQKRYSFIKV